VVEAEQLPHSEVEEGVEAVELQLPLQVERRPEQPPQARLPLMLQATLPQQEMQPPPC
jgi:hypothetical protein